MSALTVYFTCTVLLLVHLQCLPHIYGAVYAESVPVGDFTVYIARARCRARPVRSLYSAQGAPVSALTLHNAFARASALSVYAVRA